MATDPLILPVSVGPTQSLFFPTELLVAFVSVTLGVKGNITSPLLYSYNIASLKVDPTKFFFNCHNTFRAILSTLTWE